MGALCIHLSELLICGFSSRRASPWHTNGTRAAFLHLCRGCQHCILTASTVDVRDQPWGSNPELLKSLFSLCLKWECEPVDAGHEQLGVERAACLQRGLGQPQQMFTHQYTEQLSENLACVGAHAALGTLEEGRSHPCAPFHLSLVGFLPQALPRAAHPNPIPALPIPLTRIG